MALELRMLSSPRYVPKIKECVFSIWNQIMEVIQRHILGVIIDCQYKWSSHILYISITLQRRRYYLKRKKIWFIWPIHLWTICITHFFTQVWSTVHTYRVKFTLFMSIIEYIQYTLCLIIIIKSEVWTIIHCLWLDHETMVCAVCLSIFLSHCRAQ